MSRNSLLKVAILALASSACYSQDASNASAQRTPVLVELFTSEGCSSCPPADRYIEYLDSQPIPGIEIVVLSEHVDYWNRLGWKDPYSSREISERQSMYASKLHLQDVYTPQLVIDGNREMVGSEQQKVETALREAGAQMKTALQLKVTNTTRDRLQLSLESGPLATDAGPRALEVFVAFALNHAESQVERGENANRRLSHTAVLRKIVKIGKFKPGERFSLTTELNPGVSIKDGLRVIAFLQDPESRKILGAAMTHVTAP